MLLFSNFEATIALLALIVSISSLIFTYKALKYQREHNIKSVKPIGCIRLGDYESRIFVQFENNGIGPMMIKKVNVNRKSLSSKTLIDIIPKELSERIVWTNFTGNYESRTILPGENLELLVWTINSSYEQLPAERVVRDRTDLRKVLKDINIEMIYTDIYESDEFTYKIEMGEWFGRHFEA